MSIDASTSHKTQGPARILAATNALKRSGFFMLDRPLALGLRLGSLAASSEDSAILIKPGRERKRIYARALFLSNTAEERIEASLDRLDLSGWDERIRKSKRRPKLPGRHQETVRFFNRVKKRERGRSDDNDALEGARAVG